MSAPVLHACSYCGKRIVSCAGLPPGWGKLGAAVACRQCIVLARVLAS